MNKKTFTAIQDGEHAFLYDASNNSVGYGIRDIQTQSTHLYSEQGEYMGELIRNQWFDPTMKDKGFVNIPDISTDD